jgi:hypothetical protein
LYDQFSYLRKLDEFYGDSRYLGSVRPFPRYSALHSFIEFIVEYVVWEEIDDIDINRMQAIQRDYPPSALEDLKPTVLPISLAFDYYEIEHTPFEEWPSEHEKTFQAATADDVSEYYCEIRIEESYEKLIDRAVSEVFFILFQNRRLLFVFNEMMASQVAETELDELDPEIAQQFSAPGVLKRVNIPKWARNAVFFRDRGHCTLCHRDLSGTLNIGSIENYDHAVPLAKGGLNDVSNIQLLCQECNLRKRHYQLPSSDYYELWYPLIETDLSA